MFKFYRFKLIRPDIQVDPSCPVCNHKFEDDLHIFTSCPLAQSVWIHLHLGLVIEQNQYADSMKWVEQIFGLLSYAAFDRFVIGCWLLWYNRNCCLYGDKSLDSTEISRRIEVSFSEFSDLHKAIDQPNMTHISTFWDAPLPGFMKINYDGALPSGDDSIRYPWFLRTAKGNAYFGQHKNGRGLLIRHKLRLILYFL